MRNSVLFYIYIIFCITVMTIILLWQLWPFPTFRTEWKEKESQTIFDSFHEIHPSIRQTREARDTCPGPDTGVEAPEWLGEFGRDLQEARRAACFLAATILWVTEWEIRLSNQHLHPVQKYCAILAPILRRNSLSLNTLSTLSPYVAQVSK